MNSSAITPQRIALTLVLGVILPFFAAAQEPPAQEPPAIVRVDTVKHQSQTDTVSVIGRLVARRSGEVAAQVAGAIQSINIQVGDRLNINDEIAVIDNVVFNANRDLARARLGEANASVNTARAQLGLSRQVRERLAVLKNTRSASKSQYEDAVQSEAINKAQVREAEAAVSIANANLKLAEIDLSRTQVQAPYSGVVIQRLKEAGAYVKVGDALVRLLADTHMEVEADVSFERLAGLTPGTEVQLSLDDGQQYSAKVRTVIPDENRLTRTRAVRFIPSFGASDQSLAEGQSATVQIPAGANRTLLTVHKDAVNRGAQGTSVYVAESGMAKLRPVTLGPAIGNRFEVLKGLKDGEQVVVRGNERLRPDQAIQIDVDS